MKTLYVEGAGWSKAIRGYSDIPNCRIRTAFTNNDGKKIYFEVIADEVDKRRIKDKRNFGYPLGTPLGFVDFAHYITDDQEIDDCNESKVYFNGQIVERSHDSIFIFTYENLKKFINERFNCSFDEVVCLNELTGYCVHSGKARKGWGTSEMYNFGDEFPYDAEKTAKRLAKRDELKAYFEQFMQYDNASYWVDDNGDLVVRINTYEELFKKMKFKERQFTVKID